jgi:hypothetical protein
MTKARFTYFALLFILPITSDAQVTLTANGQGNTYNLITNVLAPGYNPIETPDCNHTAFGDHIDEVWDSAYGGYVFRFHIHVSPDNDRCINFDRQRNEIKTYDKSSSSLKGTLDEIVQYSWKFKLDSGFQSSPNFTHIHQLKSVGGSLESMPLYTLTTRKSNPDRLELRYAETNSQITLKHTPLSPFVDQWVYAHEIIHYSTQGSYDLEIRSLSDSSLLFSYHNDSIVNWRPNADFVRPKWGIYRSLTNSQDLRDEEVLFNDFTIHELGIFSITEGTSLNFSIHPNPAKNYIRIGNLNSEIKQILVYGKNGSILYREKSNAEELELDISEFANGLYRIEIRTGQSSGHIPFLKIQ